MQVRGVEVVERREGIEESMCAVLVAIRSRHELSDRLQVLDDMSVPVNDELVVGSHNNTPPSSYAFRAAWMARTV